MHMYKAAQNNSTGWKGPWWQEGLSATQTYKVPVAPPRLAGSGLSAHTPLGHALWGTSKKKCQEIISLCPFWTLISPLGVELSFRTEVTCSPKQRKAWKQTLKERKPPTVYHFSKKRRERSAPKSVFHFLQQSVVLFPREHGDGGWTWVNYTSHWLQQER